ncbi:uncharacterized protein Z520_11680 [Fonsecaea multimorphosa CBS 102226]|uniref:Major facilitator superfamily (MFS) profile domain-containing protein n=1 Tax=Fonsecaea multimorphosa CBS 102226 TaxID=1442371 RepID=A0A0D2I5V5_9EURO|nr:uncharacterized protein Z520_11680 [Fonsecaea multimorphosa CBS 102226]KIX92651.1 hypothetical protein Z520_11680 [Fonsecaea multimorphosa CBS 102226]OAL17875.1 hypothetical protein AYO22_11219 [Fonsecaea multimorphosa]
MSSKEVPATVHQETEFAPANERAKAHGQLGAAHLFIEDSVGNVTGRVLIPRPTDDPKDPLTWTRTRKEIAFWSISYFIFLSNYTVASISPGLVAIQEHFEVTGSYASYFITMPVLFIGIGNLFWIPLSRKIGKRPVLILSSLTFFLSCLWSAVAKSGGSMLGSRIIQGFGASCPDAMGPAVVADLFFVHERGQKLGWYTLVIAFGNSFGAIFAGLITNATPNWRWIFWMDAIVTGVLFLLMVFAMPETNFERPTATEMGETEDLAPVLTQEKRSHLSYVQSLKVTSFYDKKTSLLKHFWRPLTLTVYPAVWYAGLTQGVGVGWVILQQTANSIFYPALYNYSGLAVGNINVANIISACIACLYGGIGSDMLVAWITKRRGGYFQPEYRLWGALPIFPFVPLSLMLWGCALYYKLDPFVGIAGFGITYGVLCAISPIALTYLVDCYRPLAGETLTIATAIKNVFAFGICFAVVPWIQKDGFIKVSGYSTLIEGLIFVSTIPLYIYGERIRNWTSKLSI